jgi:hypothetical protein
MQSGDVAQLVRALPCHGRGRGFEPRRPRHKPKESKVLAKIVALFHPERWHRMESAILPICPNNISTWLPLALRLSTDAAHVEMSIVMHELRPSLVPAPPSHPLRDCGDWLLSYAGTKCHPITWPNTFARTRVERMILISSMSGARSLVISSAVTADLRHSI